MTTNPYGWPVDPIEPLTYITDRLNNRKPFVYLRFNDGEMYSMLGMKHAPESNGEHVYSQSIADALTHSFGMASGESVYFDNVLLGSWWYEDPQHPAVKEFLKFITTKLPADKAASLIVHTKWSRGSLWHREELELEGKCLTDELLRWVDAVRSFNGPKWVVGNLDVSRKIAPAIGGIPAWIRERDAEGSKDFSMKWDNCVGDLVIWCAGFPAKPWAWKSWIESNRQSYHIDAGSLFDGLCGKESREWLKRNGSAHSKFYYGEFARYLGIEV